MAPSTGACGDFKPRPSINTEFPHLPGTREFFTCLDGRVHLMVAGERHALEAGDVLAFPGNVAHSYQNADALAPARGVSVVVLAKAGT
ncbi:MAG TPA: cupin domain-containing protein [Burkholderiaceae bacterium]|nr:cupin domain-containing protein [Burkholderiaceae bacterium]